MVVTVMHTMARQSHTHGHVQNKVMTSSKSADNMPQHFQRDNQADEVSAETESPARNSKVRIATILFYDLMLLWSSRTL